MPRRNELLLLVLILGLSMGLRLVFIHEPFERDEGFYATIAQEILHGAIPYRDAIDIKPPGIYYIYAAVISLLGASTESIRIGTAFFCALTILSIHLVTKFISGERAGLFAALLYGIYSCSPRLQATGSNTEMFLALPLVLSIMLFLKGGQAHKNWHIIGSGCAAGIAMLIKTQALPTILMLCGMLFFTKHSRASRNNVSKHILLFIAPLVGIGVITILYFTYYDSFDNFIYWNIGYARKYAGKELMSSFSVLEMFKFLMPELVVLLILAIPTALWILLVKRTPQHIVIVLFLITSFAAALLPWKNYPHYFILLLPPLSILAGIGFSELIATKAHIKWVGVTAVAVSFTWSLVKTYPCFEMSPEEISFFKYGISEFADSVTIAKYLQNNMSRSDYLFQWGFEPELYFLSDRRPTSPYLSNIHISLASNPKKAIDETIRSLNEKKPKYIAVQDSSTNSYGIKQIKEVVNRDYVFDRKIAYAYLFRRKQI